MTQGATLYALLIGIDSYETPDIRDLRSARQDVLSIQRILNSHAGWGQIKCEVMTSPPTGTGNAPTKGRILGQLDRFSRAPMTEDDMFLFYFAGHGIDQGGEQFLLGHDVPLDRSLSMLRDCALSLRSLKDSCDLIGAGQQMLVLDACRNDPTQGTRSLGGDDDVGVVITRDIGFIDADTSDVPVSGTRRAWVSACASKQKSYEYAESGNSWFCHNLLKVLDETTGLEVSVKTLVDRVSDRMRQNAWSDLPQASEQQPSLVTEGPPVILRLAPGPRIDPSSMPETLQTPAPSVEDAPVKPAAQPIDIGPLSIDIEPVPIAAPVPNTAGLGPIPDEWTRVESLLLGVERTIKEVENRTHEQLIEPSAACDARLKLASDTHDAAKRIRPSLPKSQLEKLEALAHRETPPRPSEIASIAPGASLANLSSYVGMLRRSTHLWNESARHAVIFDRVINDTTVRLEDERRVLKADLLKIQKQDLVRILVELFKSCSDSQVFPFDLIVELIPSLKERGYRWSSDVCLKKAECCHDCWLKHKEAGDSDSPDADWLTDDDANEGLTQYPLADSKSGGTVGDYEKGLHEFCELIISRCGEDIENANLETLCDAIVTANKIVPLEGLWSTSCKGTFRTDLPVQLSEKFQRISNQIIQELREYGPRLEDPRFKLKQVGDILRHVFGTVTGLIKQGNDFFMIEKLLREGTPWTCPEVGGVDRYDLGRGLSSFASIGARLADGISPVIYMVDQHGVLGRTSFQDIGEQTQWFDVLPDQVRSFAQANENVAVLGLMRGGVVLARSLMDQPRIETINVQQGQVLPVCFGQGAYSGSLFAVKEHTVIGVQASDMIYSSEWDHSWPTDERVRTYHTGAITCVATPYIGDALVSGSRDGCVRLEPDSKEGGAPWPLAYQLGVQVNSLAFSPRGDRIVIAGNTPEVHLISTADGSVLHKTAMLSRFVTTAAFTFSGLAYCTGGDDGIVSLWRADDGELLWTQKLHGSRVIGISFSRDGKWLVSAGKDGTVARIELVYNN